MYGSYRLPVRAYFSDFVVHGVECIPVQFSYVWHNQWLILSASRTQDSSVDRSTGTGFYRLPVRTYFSDFIVHGVECITVQFSMYGIISGSSCQQAGRRTAPSTVRLAPAFTDCLCVRIFLRFYSAWCGMYNCSVLLCMA